MSEIDILTQEYELNFNGPVVYMNMNTNNYYTKDETNDAINTAKNEVLTQVGQEYYNKTQIDNKIDEVESKIPSVDGALSLTSENPVQNKAITENIIIKSNVIPEASADLVGSVYQFSGENGIYIHGYIYECVETSQTSVTFTPSDVFCDGANFDTFINIYSGGIGWENIVSGTMVYEASSDMWSFVGKDADNNIIVSVQLFTQDFVNYGFSFSDNPQDGDEVNFVRNIEPVYYWQQIDVQPKHWAHRSYIAQINDSEWTAESAESSYYFEKYPYIKQYQIPGFVINGNDVLNTFVNIAFSAKDAVSGKLAPFINIFPVSNEYNELIMMIQLYATEPITTENFEIQLHYAGEE